MRIRATVEWNSGVGPGRSLSVEAGNWRAIRGERNLRGAARI